MKKEKKEKKYIAPNEASLGRWSAALAVGGIVGVLLSTPFSFMMQTASGSFMGISCYSISALLAFAAIFWGLVIGIKVVGKTSMKDFILGVGGSVNMKECLTILGLYAVGMVLNFLPDAKYIYVREGFNLGNFLVLLLVMLLLTWTQTSTEELIFRGMVIRWTCKNEVGFTKKAVIAGIVASFAFAVAHATNPEVTSQGGIRVIMAVLSYAIPGLMFHFANLQFGSLLPGLLIHWLNNFVLFTVIASEVTAMPVPTLLVNAGPHAAENMLLNTTLAYLPLAVYMVLKARANKKAKAEN